jgi:ATP adenylyltransferase
MLQLSSPLVYATDQVAEHRVQRVEGGCYLCAQLGTAARALGNEPVARNMSFEAWPSWGPVTEGHVIVVPRDHVFSFAQLSPGDLVAAETFVREVEQRVAGVYGQTCLFEHGANVAGSAVGCSVDHAHVHVVPWGGDFISAARDDYASLSWHNVPDFSGLPADEPYLFVRDARGNAAVGTGSGIPSQALRRTLTSRMGRSDSWDWKTHPNTRTLTRTRSRLAMEI